MKRVVAAVLYVALLFGSVYAAYVWGWYRGLGYHSLVSGLSEAKVALSAAESLRQQDPQLALELLDANISWMSTALAQTDIEVPADEQGTYDIVMRRLRDYRARYAQPVGR